MLLEKKMDSKAPSFLSDKMGAEVLRKSIGCSQEYSACLRPMSCKSRINEADPLERTRVLF